jgi:hypothetical protein
MTTNDLRAVAHRIVVAMVKDHPAEAAVIASFVLSEILAIGLHADGDPADVAAFVAAINARLGEIALWCGASRAWQLVPCDPVRSKNRNGREAGALCRGGKVVPEALWYNFADSE